MVAATLNSVLSMLWTLHSDHLMKTKITIADPSEVEEGSRFQPLSCPRGFIYVSAQKLSSKLIKIYEYPWKSYLDRSPSEVSTAYKYSNGKQNFINCDLIEQNNSTLNQNIWLNFITFFRKIDALN